MLIKSVPKSLSIIPTTNFTGDVTISINPFIIVLTPSLIFPKSKVNIPEIILKIPAIYCTIPPNTVFATSNNGVNRLKILLYISNKAE